MKKLPLAALLLSLLSAVAFRTGSAARHDSSRASRVPATPGAETEPFDAVILNGRVVDGGGNPWFRADVGIRNGRIAKVGYLKNAQAAKIIDARGLYVAPGFIDMHNHSDRGLRDPRLRLAKQFLTQGVTTVVLGVDGMGTPEMIREARQWEKEGMGLNTGFYVGHNSIRIQVMGITNRAPTPAELEKMKQMVQTGMESGAFGFSSGLVYIPSIYSATGEVVELAKVAAAYGGIYDTHHRDEMVAFLQSLREALEISDQAGLPLHVAHIKVMGQDNWGQMGTAVELIQKARARGQEITADQYPWPNGAMRTSLAPILQLPPGMGKLEKMYKNLKGNPEDFSSREEQLEYTAELVKALKDPVSRERIRRANEEGLSEVGSRNWIKKWGYGWLRVEHSVRNPQYIGMTIPDIARKKGLDPFSVVAELTLTEDENFVVSIGPCSEKDVLTALKEPWLMFSSDGELVPFGERWVNARAMATFPRVYRKYVREEHAITLEDAVRKMTGLTAQTLRLRDRGLLREGMWADVTVFDADRIADKSTYADPHHYSEGVVHVLVNGTLELENGELTGKAAGRVMYRPGR